LWLRWFDSRLERFEVARRLGTLFTLDAVDGLNANHLCYETAYQLAHYFTAHMLRMREIKSNCDRCSLAVWQVYEFNYCHCCIWLFCLLYKCIYYFSYIWLFVWSIETQTACTHIIHAYTNIHIHKYTRYI